jgi:hypothetical protein
VLLSSGFFLLGRVDPGCAWQFRRGGWLADEAPGVGVVGTGQDVGAGGLDRGGVSVVDVGGGVQAEAAVAVLVVVPTEEFLAVGPGVLDRGEPATCATCTTSLACTVVTRPWSRPAPSACWHPSRGIIRLCDAPLTLHDVGLGAIWKPSQSVRRQECRRLRRSYPPGGDPARVRHLAVRQELGLGGRAGSYRGDQHARSLGINFFDPAQAYGSGRSERLLGRALAAQLRSARESVVIATKADCGWTARTWPASPAQRGCAKAWRPAAKG